MKQKAILYLCITIPFCLCLDIFTIMIFQNKMKNPYRVEIQKLMDEAGIEDLQIQMEYGNNVLTGIAVEGNEEFYRSDRVFREVDRVQKIITSYMSRHPDAFVMDYEKDSNGVLYSGFEILFVNSDVRSSNPNRIIFKFSQTGEKLRENADTMNCIAIKGEYWYKISSISEFPDIEEFHCLYMILDNESVIKKLPNARKIKFYNVTGGDQRNFIKKAKKKGILVESDDLPEGDGETNYDEINSNLKKIQGD